MIKKITSIVFFEQNQKENVSYNLKIYNETPNLEVLVIHFNSFDIQNFENRFPNITFLNFHGTKNYNDIVKKLLLTIETEYVLLSFISDVPIHGKFLEIDKLLQSEQFDLITNRFKGVKLILNNIYSVKLFSLVINNFDDKHQNLINYKELLTSIFFKSEKYSSNPFYLDYSFIFYNNWFFTNEKDKSNTDEKLINKIFLHQFFTLLNFLNIDKSFKWFNLSSKLFLREIVYTKGKYSLFPHFLHVCWYLFKNKNWSFSTKIFSLIFLFKNTFFATLMFDTKQVKISSKTPFRNENTDSELLPILHQELRTTFKKLLDELYENNIKLIAHSGTSLAIERNNQFIPWDDDLDFFISIKDLVNNYEKIVEIAKKYQYDFIGFSNEDGIFNYHCFKFVKDMNFTSLTEDKIKYPAILFIDVWLTAPLQSLSFYKEQRKNGALYLPKRNQKSYFLTPFYYFRWRWIPYRPSLTTNFAVNYLGFINPLKKSNRKIAKVTEDNLLLNGNWNILNRTDRYALRYETYNPNETEFETLDDLNILVVENNIELIIKAYGDNWKYDIKKSTPHSLKWINRQYAINQNFLLKFNKKTYSLEIHKQLNDPKYDMELINKIRSYHNSL
ncbi:MAG: hypothetical protein GQ557_00615 [Mycoplasmataceae bacterium]|nr:hypothetical protein [Mycoplasmataceae bacterium]